MKVKDMLQAARLHAEFNDLARMRSSLRAEHRRVRFLIDSGISSAEIEMEVRHRFAKVLQDRQFELVEALRALGITDLPEIDA